MTIRAYNIVSYGSIAGIAPACDSPSNWRDEAACKGDLDIFDDPKRWIEARTICLGCDVKDECLDEALAEGRLEMFRAGFTPKELVDIARVVKRPTRVGACLFCAGQVTGRAQWCASCRPKAKKRHR